ncbi:MULTISPECIES: oxidoreductase [Bacillus amyloliquefaciens group]|uniref:oxidoreductase n=1 Tax=Bacillus amyloliquefaciens group TaxID=1938374 RepID=UPI00057C018A|nr:MULTISPECIES: oxidoreductase [Bacillus amyloliquefaciens group]MEB3987370.1 oxidoreductase [Bacillus velezensis]POR14365.1 oxidoreductase [Bacillus velezensis]QCE19750.1 oxidoreductase [Bacillus velezensis]UFK56460.1 oxidoreductase [Bacillus amyloliquefaciens]
MKTIQVGILGYGLSGKVFHAPLLDVLDDYQIKKVMTSRTDEVKRDLPGAEAVRAIEDITGDPDIDLVIVTTPSGMHYESAMKCLLAGKHTVVEKPVTATSAEAEELRRTAENKGVLLSVYHNRRWDNDFLTIQKLIRDGALQDIHTYQVSYDLYNPVVQEKWREMNGPATGTLYDLGSHIIDQTLLLFGMPESVTAHVMKQRDNSETVDNFLAALHYGKLQVILQSGSMNAASGPRYQIHGRNASFIKYGMDGQEDALSAGKKPIDDSWGADDPDNFGELTIAADEKRHTETIPSENGSYLTYYKLLADSILNGKPLPVTAKEGIDVIRVIEAAMKSSEQKRTIAL